MKLINKKTATVLTVIFLFLIVISGVEAQNIISQDREFEEIVISFEVPKAIVSDIFVQYDGNTVYLPLIKVFTLLDINIQADITERKFHGFFISKDNKFEFNMAQFKINVFGREIPYLASDYYLSDNDLFIKVESFNKIFDLNMDFDFTMLRVFLRLNEDFPVYQKLKRKIAREKLQQEEESLRDVIDLAYKRRYLSGGTVDWLVSANPYGGRNKHYYNMKFGGMVLGGDLLLNTGGSFGDNTSSLFESKQFNYKWHYSFNDNSYITQAEIGDVSGGGALSRSIKGLKITNRPQVRRKFFQTINITNYIGAGWEVELFVDNKLTDYMYTDADGFYHFSTDIYYGSSHIELKMYGPNGEYTTEEQVVRVPFNLIPHKEYEYSLSVGEAYFDQVKRNYIQANSFYGLLDNITVGLSSDIPLSGIDTVENITSTRIIDEKPMFGLEATCQVIGSMTLNSSIVPNYVARARANYSLPSLVNLNISYDKFFENQSRNPQEQLFRANFAISSPLKIAGKNLGLRYNISMDKFAAYTTMNMNYGFNLVFNPMYVTYIGQYKNKFNSNEIINSISSYKSISSQLLITTRFLPFVRPQFRVDYDHSDKGLLKYGVYVAKRIFRTSQITFSYERNHLSKSNTFLMTLNLLQPFADMTSRVNRNGDNMTYNQMFRGSVRYDNKNKTVHFDRRNSVGYGSAVVKPFLDDNYNGVMDNDEEYISGLRAKIKGARVKISGENKEYFYNNLRPYEEYMVQIDQYSLDDPMLKPTHENYKIKIDPNTVTSIQVPIVTASELSGKVERQIGKVKSGTGGFKIYIMNISKEQLIELPTFSSGDFYYLGLIPGSYRAYIDREQLENYGYKCQPEFIEFEIKPVEGGTFIENLDFLLVPQNPTTESK